MNLATTIYFDSEDTEAATAIVRSMITPISNRPSNASDAATQSSQTKNEASQTQRSSAVASKITQR